MSQPKPSALILVADDNDDCRNSLTDLLEISGYSVISASNGREALRAAREHHPSAIFTDIDMPEMDGYELAATIRDDETLGGTFLVAVSGWGKQHNPQREADAAFDRHLIKPADISEILDAAAEVTARREPRGGKYG